VGTPPGASDSAVIAASQQIVLSKEKWRQDHDHNRRHSEHAVVCEAQRIRNVKEWRSRLLPNAVADYLGHRAISSSLCYVRADATAKVQAVVKPMSFGAGTFLRKSQNSVGDDTRLGLQRIRSFSVSFGELSNLPIRMQTCLRKSCVTTFAKPNEFFKAKASGKA